MMDDSVDGLKYLNDNYNVLIVSAATEFSVGLVDKIYWLEKHFPFISKKQIILCGEKYLLTRSRLHSYRYMERVNRITIIKKQI